mmetsp:Transcript_20204/g.31218  ORF Transcript_20204/g.31218 Transcript_20204/m.31218 type:complete len:105 (-) Transcript_20204:39-353(-)
MPGPVSEEGALEGQGPSHEGGQKTAGPGGNSIGLGLAVLFLGTPKEQLGDGGDGVQRGEDHHEGKTQTGQRVSWTQSCNDVVDDHHQHSRGNGREQLNVVHSGT